MKRMMATVVLSFIFAHAAFAKEVPEDTVGSCYHGWSQPGSFLPEDQYRALIHKGVVFIREGSGEHEQVVQYLGKGPDGKDISVVGDFGKVDTHSLSDGEFQYDKSNRYFRVSSGGHCDFENGTFSQPFGVQQFTKGQAD